MDYSSSGIVSNISSLLKQIIPVSHYLFQFMRNRVPAMFSLCCSFIVEESLSENIAFILPTSEVWHFWSDSFINSTNISKVLYGRCISISKSLLLRDDWSSKLHISSLSSSVRTQLEMRLSKTSLSSIVELMSLSLNSFKSKNEVLCFYKKKQEKKCWES